MSNREKKLHITAAVLFGIAIFLYIVGAKYALGFSLLGCAVEIAAWISWVSNSRREI